MTFPIRNLDQVPIVVEVEKLLIHMVCKTQIDVVLQHFLNFAHLINIEFGFLLVSDVFDVFGYW